MDYKKSFNSLNYCLKCVGSILIYSPIVFFIIVITDDDIRIKLADVIEFYSKTLIHSTVISIPFSILFTLWVSYINIKVKDTIIFKGIVAFSSVFLLVLIYSLPIHIHFESLVQNENMRFIYGIMTFIIPFTMKRKLYEDLN